MLLVAFGLGCASLLNFSTHPLRVLNITTWWSVVGLIVATYALLHWPSRLWRRLALWAGVQHIYFPLFFLAIILGAFTPIRQAIRLQFPQTHTGHTLLLWCLAWSALLVSVWSPARGSLRAWLPRHRWELAGVLAATLLGAALRFYQLGSIPNILNGDEGLIGIWALDLASFDPKLARHFGAMDGVGVLYIHLLHRLFVLAGPSPFTLRLLPAIAGTLAIPANYLLARHLLGRRAAIIATGLLLVSHVHLQFSHTVAVSYIYATLFIPLALYMLITGMERRSAFRLALSAVIVGIHINIYLDGWIWLVLLLLILIAWWFIDRPLFEGNGINLAIFALAFVIVVAPMLVWARMFSADFVSRLTVDGTIGSGWLQKEAQVSGKSQLQILGELFLYALSTFTIRPFQEFYHVDAPTLEKITGLLWIGGVVLALVKTWDRRMVMINGWFWGGIVTLAVMTVPPGTYHYRLVPVLPAACMMAGAFLDWLLKIGMQGISANSRRYYAWSAALIGPLLLVVAYQNLHLYYGEFANSCVYESNYWTRESALLGNYLRTLPHDTQAFVLATDLDAGFYYGPYKSVDFLSNHMAVANIVEPLGETPPAVVPVAPSTPLVFVAGPDRWHELERVQTWYPGGVVDSITDCGQEVLRIYNSSAKEAEVIMAPQHQL
jgi:hypothetical protein